MSLFQSRTGRAQDTAMERLLPVLSTVHDGLGNVPVGMQEDPKVNGLLTGCVEAVCRECGLAEAKHPHVLSAVYERIYRREGLAVLAACDRWVESADAAYSEGRTAGGAADGIDALAQYIDANYERPDTLVL